MTSLSGSGSELTDPPFDFEFVPSSARVHLRKATYGPFNAGPVQAVQVVKYEQMMMTKRSTRQRVKLARSVQAVKFPSNLREKRVARMRSMLEPAPQVV